MTVTNPQTKTGSSYHVVQLRGVTLRSTSVVIHQYSSCGCGLATNISWASATVCKTVCPILSDCCLSVLSCLSVCLWHWCIVAKRLNGLG